MSIEVSAEDVKLGAYLQIPLARCRPIRPCSLTSPISIIVTLCLHQEFLHTPLSGASQKWFESGPAPGYNCICKTFHRCFVNIYRYGFKSPARNGDLKSMSFVYIVTSISV